MWVFQGYNIIIIKGDATWRGNLRLQRRERSRSTCVRSDLASSPLWVVDGDDAGDDDYDANDGDDDDDDNDGDNDGDDGDNDDDDGRLSHSKSVRELAETAIQSWALVSNSSKDLEW